MERSEVHFDEVGVDYGEVPPVPIPNTEVKLISADDTWLETARENRCSPTQNKEGCCTTSTATLFVTGSVKYPVGVDGNRPTMNGNPKRADYHQPLRTTQRKVFILRDPIFQHIF